MKLITTLAENEMTDHQDLQGDPDSSSNCCGARITPQGLCSDCKEHCEDERDAEPTDEQLERQRDSAYRAEEQRVLKEDEEDRELRLAGRGHLLPP